MPRKYKPKVGSRTYKKYSDNDLEEALLKITNGELSIKKASETYNISYGTLHNKYHGKHGLNAGGQTVLTLAEEESIVRSLITCGEWGYPLAMFDLQMFTKYYLDKKGVAIKKFSNNTPGIDWARSFLDRHKDKLAQRFGSNISKARSSLSKETLTDYFSNLSETIQDIPATHIFNYDESNLTDDPGKKKLIYRRGTKYPEKVMNHTKSSTTIMMCGAASGILIPPYVVYRSEHMWDTWTEGGPKGFPCCDEPCCSNGSRYNRTSHGWMEALCFSDWFHTVLLPHARRLEGRKVLIGDNLASHFTEDVLTTCRKENISFVCLPPNSTHICQPLDVAFFRPMKIAWRAILTRWKMRNPRQQTIPRSAFPALLQSLLEKMNNVNTKTKNTEDDCEGAIARNLVSAFEATGIVPLNPNRVLSKLPKNTENAEETEKAVNDSLIEFLRERRYGEPDKGLTRKRKRMTVSPGKSIAGPSNVQESTESESESEMVLDPDDVEDDACESGVNDACESGVVYAEPSVNDLKVGQFVLVKVISGKRKSVSFQYVATIQECGKEEVTVMGLKSCNTKSVFKPVENDVFSVELKDVLAILPEPFVEQSGDRYRYIFSSEIDVKEN